MISVFSFIVLTECTALDMYEHWRCSSDMFRYKCIVFR